MTDDAGLGGGSAAGGSAAGNSAAGNSATGNSASSAPVASAPVAVGQANGAASGPVAGQPAVGTAPRTESARPHWAVFVGLAAGVAIVDQIVKQWIVANFEVGVPVNVVGDWARIVLVHNNGALFGMFRDQAIIFAVLSVIVIGLIVSFELRAGSAMLVSVALGLLLGGALGNLIDRLRLGYVVDFVDLGIGSWRWYTFNVADAAISLSILLLLVLAIRPPASLSSSSPRG